MSAVCRRPPRQARRFASTAASFAPSPKRARARHFLEDTMGRSWRALGAAVVVTLAFGWAADRPHARHDARAKARAYVQNTPKVRLAIAGLTHDHVHGAFRQLDAGEIAVVGIYEPNAALAERYAAQHHIDRALLFTDLGKMLDTVKPEAVAAFGSIYDHLAVVQAAAPRGVHVMVEKPLAVSLEHANAIQALAAKHRIHVLTNYETSWYPTTHEAFDIAVTRGELGTIRKVVVHDGHRGPKEIGVSPEFLEWLTDPVKNGGGALIDFGCYGADLITWLMKGAEPTSVSAVTQQLKPHIYPKVDDEATIVVTYPGAQGIIQASWNWPISRKDMEVYGETGQLVTVDGKLMRVRRSEQVPDEEQHLPPRTAPLDDPFKYFAAVVSGTVTVADTDLAALPLNVTVVKILDAARTSAKTGRTISLQ
jgi:scyllo-inositol 2-dehydrogenase (NADP+)